MSSTASAPEAHATITEQRGAPDGRRLVDVGPGDEPWRDPGLSVDDRVADLLKRMTLEEKLGQLASVWLGAAVSTDDLAPDPGGDRDVAPHQHDMADETLDWVELIRPGLGQLTRPFGTAPVDPVVRRPGAGPAAGRDRGQQPVRHPGRRPRGVPDRLHDLGRHRLSRRRWPGAPPSTPRWSRQMARASARPCARSASTRDSRPVLDVTRDPRWGRTEETIGEDPYLVGTLGTAYVRGLESSRDRRHAQALRRATPGRGPAATSARSRSGGASSPTCSCRRSRWRSARAAPARSCTPTPRSTASRRRPTATC